MSLNLVFNHTLFEIKANWFISILFQVDLGMGMIVKKLKHVSG